MATLTISLVVIYVIILVFAVRAAAEPYLVRFFRQSRQSWWQSPPRGANRELPTVRPDRRGRAA
jgi:hypothetical protein